MNSAADTNVAQRPLAILGWAAFLGISWTWCIGMFLPVLLIRDYGSWSWVIFAIPNVVGAAAMGWVLVRPGSSERMVADHTGAMTAFSIVTILFHVLFAAWVIKTLGDWTIVAGAAGAAIVFFPLLLYRTAARLIAFLVLGLSLACFGYGATQLGRIPVAPAVSEYGALLPLGAVCVLGFALCPYLDLTFHRARQSVSSYGSVAAFTLGFGVLFLSMIVFTLWYAPLLIGETGHGPVTVPAVVLTAIAIHMAGQSGYTVAAHTVELVRRCRDARGGARAGTVLGALYGVAILISAYLLNDRGGYLPMKADTIMPAGEVGYRLFLAFYGLITPAYVWIVLVPWRRQQSTRRQRWIVLLVVLALASPTFWIGFIEKEMVWVLAGVAAVLLSRPLLEWATQPRGQTSVSH